MTRHIAVIAPPLPGHWDPLRVLGRELVSRGHRVTFLHMGDAAPMAAEPDLGFAAVGAETHGPGALARYRAQLARAPGRRGFFEMIHATAAISDMLLRELPDALARIGADAVIADETEAAGGMVARLLGVPFVTSITGLPLLRERSVPPPFIRWHYHPGRIGQRRNAGGYAVADVLMRPMRRVLARHAAATGLDLREAAASSLLLQVAQCPPRLDFPRKALPPAFRYCGPFRAPSQPEVALPDDGRPLVYCSLGSLQGDRPGLFAAMTQACADVGARALVAHGGLLDSEAARRLPGDPVVGAFWPQPAVLPHCSAAILHGGFNTVLDALAAAVPMVVVPLAFEQPGTAARVAWTGAGRAIMRGRLSRRRLHGALERVLMEASYREAAQTLSGEMASLGGAFQAADLIDEAFRTERTPARAPARAA